MSALARPWLDRLAAAWARRASDSTIERRLGSRRGQARLMRALARRFDPERTPGLAGELQIDLRAAAGGGAPSPWTIVVGERAAHARPGPAAQPMVTVIIGVVDLVRVALRQTDADRLLLEGHLDLAGDWRVASRIGAMLGRSR